MTSSIATLTFDEALEAALQDPKVKLMDFVDNPAALCLLSSKDERRVKAGLLLRSLLADSSVPKDTVKTEFFDRLQKEGVSELAAKAFWCAHCDMTNKWLVSFQTVESFSFTSEKSVTVAQPVLFAVHVPRA